MLIHWAYMTSMYFEMPSNSYSEVNVDFEYIKIFLHAL